MNPSRSFTSFTSSTTSHIAPASLPQRPFVHMVHALSAPSHRRLKRSRLHRGCCDGPPAAPSLGVELLSLGRCDRPTAATSTNAFVAKRSPGTGDWHDRGVSIGIASSGRAGTIALQECDRRAAGAIRRSRTAEFGRLQKSRSSACKSPTLATCVGRCCAPAARPALPLVVRSGSRVPDLAVRHRRHQRRSRRLGSREQQRRRQ